MICIDSRDYSSSNNYEHSKQQKVPGLANFTIWWYSSCKLQKGQLKVYLLLQSRRPDPDCDQNKVQKGQMETEEDGNLSKVNYTSISIIIELISIHII